jgi:aryl-phospho-beta-D-glucosidase BglC (GH1 family)
MNKRINGLSAALAVMLLLPITAFAQLPTTTYGWNLGNTMEPPCGEGCWSPPVTQAVINAVAANGFNLIRIPVAWMSHANSRTYQIDAAWMARVKQVVDWSRAANLTVVINIHWDGGWFDSNGFRRFDSKLNKKYQTIWSQIATTFRDYDSKLLFCAANEPDADTQAETAVLLQYYQTFVNTVRATGGNNATRWLVLPGPQTNIDKTNDWVNTLPTDSALGRLAIDVHYYDPYNFTLMTADESWGNMSYFWGQGYHSATMPIRNSTWGEEQWLNDQFEKMRTKFINNGIPVLIGEFASSMRIEYPDLTGTELTRHLASRTYFDQQIVSTAIVKGLKPIYWDPGFAGKNTSAVFDRVTATVSDPDGVRALTGGVAVPPPP